MFHIFRAAASYFLQFPMHNPLHDRLDELYALRHLHLYANSELVEAREDLIEALGDFMCNPSAAFPAQSELAAMEDLAAAEADARESYSRCALAVGSTWVRRISDAASTHPTGPERASEAVSTSVKVEL